MDSEIENLRKELQEEQRRLQEEQRRREEAEGRLLAAEKLAKSSQLQTLQQYLEACHSLNLAIQVVTDRSLTTQGDTTKPIGRIFPQRIVPWDDFVTKQEKIWNDVLGGELFCSQRVFPSPHQFIQDSTDLRVERTHRVRGRNRERGKKPCERRGRLLRNQEDEVGRTFIFCFSMFPSSSTQMTSGSTYPLVPTYFHKFGCRVDVSSLNSSKPR
jgi:hypothetical protein